MDQNDFYFCPTVISFGKLQSVSVSENVKLHIKMYSANKLN